MKFNINLIFRAIALAMGIVVVVLSILHSADNSTLTMLLGIGLACLAMSTLNKKKEN